MGPVENEHNLIERVLDMAIAIQQIPAPTFKEQQRAAFVHEQLLREGQGFLQDVGIDRVGNVYARLPGAVPGPPLVISAHLDTVFPEDTPLTPAGGIRQGRRVYGPGIGDNALGVAGLFGILWSLSCQEPPRAASLGQVGDIWLVANVGEEGLGNLLGMRAVVDRFGAAVRGYVILEGMALGQIYHIGLGVRRYRVRTKTQGGHAWVDYGRPSAVHELARLATRLVELPLPAKPRTSLNIGTISGGISINTIAAEAQFDVDLRSESGQVLGKIARQLEELLTTTNRKDIEVTAEVIGERPEGRIPPDHRLVQLAQQVLKEEGIEAVLNAGSTDANIPLSRGYAAICIGLTRGGGAHTTEEFIEADGLDTGLRQVFHLIKGVFSE